MEDPFINGIHALATESRRLLNYRLKDRFRIRRCPPIRNWPRLSLLLQEKVNKVPARGGKPVTLPVQVTDWPQYF